MPAPPSIMLALAPWKGREVNALSLAAPLLEALRAWPIERPRLSGFAGGLLVDFLTPAAMTAALQVVLRGNTWAVGVFLRPHNQPRLAAPSLAERARHCAWGVAVHPDRSSPTTAAAIDAALALYAAVLRGRSEPTWRAIDAARLDGTATAAARSLGCSQQAVSAHLRRGHRDAAARAHLVVEALLAGANAP